MFQDPDIKTYGFRKIRTLNRVKKIWIFKVRILAENNGSWTCSRWRHSANGFDFLCIFIFWDWPTNQC